MRMCSGLQSTGDVRSAVSFLNEFSGEQVELSELPSTKASSVLPKQGARPHVANVAGIGCLCFRPFCANRLALGNVRNSAKEIVSQKVGKGGLAG